MQKTLKGTVSKVECLKLMNAIVNQEMLPQFRILKDFFC
jgi:hypothetical protein